jgi:hypothetical protein
MWLLDVCLLVKCTLTCAVRLVPGSSPPLGVSAEPLSRTEAVCFAVLLSFAAECLRKLSGVWPISARPGRHRDVAPKAGAGTSPAGT